MQFLHPPSVQFKLYQGEVLRRGLYQELGGIHPSLQRFVPGTGCNPPIPRPFQSERGIGTAGASRNRGSQSGVASDY